MNDHDRSPELCSSHVALSSRRSHLYVRCPSCRGRMRFSSDACCRLQTAGLEFPSATRKKLLYSTFDRRVDGGVVRARLGSSPLNSSVALRLPVCVEGRLGVLYGDEVEACRSRSRSAVGVAVALPFERLIQPPRGPAGSGMLLLRRARSCWLTNTGTGFASSYYPHSLALST